MAKRQSIVWKFIDLVEQEKDGIKVKNAVCKICVDTILMYADGTSNLMHHLEARHLDEYCKAKSEESGNESDKPSLPVHPSMKRCSLARSKEINTTIVDFVVLDLRPIAVVDVTDNIVVGYVVELYNGEHPTLILTRALTQRSHVTLMYVHSNLRMRNK